MVMNAQKLGRMAMNWRVQGGNENVFQRYNFYEQGNLEKLCKTKYKKKSFNFIAESKCKDIAETKVGKQQGIVAMNVQELQRETQRMESKRILDNVSTFYQKYISVEMEKGNGEVRYKECRSDSLIGEEEIKYLETLGYVFFRLKPYWDVDVEYIITWTEKAENKWREDVEKDQWRCKKNKLIWLIWMILIVMIIGIEISGVIKGSLDMTFFGLLLCFGLFVPPLVAGGGMPKLSDSKYLYITPKSK